MGRFEKNLLEHVKKIRDGTALINPSKHENNQDKNLMSPNAQSKIQDIMNDKIKDNFKIDKRSQIVAKKLFEMITQGSAAGNTDSKMKEVSKKDLKNFIVFLKSLSDHNILANKTFLMLNRLEKAINLSQRPKFDDFLKFVC